MEGEGEGSHAWRPMEGEGEALHARWPMQGEGEGSFLPLLIFPPTIFTQTFHFYFFSFDLNLLLYHGSRPLLTPFLTFPCL